MQEVYSLSMIKICSLDFLNKERFEADIFTADGRILCPRGSKITPDLLLRLYFKDIYVEEWPEDVKSKTSADVEDEISRQLKSISPSVEEDSSTELEKPEEEVAKLFELTDEVPAVIAEEKLEFDEEEAKRVSEYALKIGKLLNFPKNRLNELEQAAYYCKIGRTRFSNLDLTQKDFNKKQALASYDILLKEKKMPEKVAEASKFYLDNYNPVTFKLDEEIPYAHIISIASYYDASSIKQIPNDDILKKMLQLGGNKFNIYVLHKFINTMRENK